MGKLIDADVLMTWFNGNYDDEDVSVAYVLGIINEQPEAVVRCKDCKFSDPKLRGISSKWLPCMEIQTHRNWYCGSAERRTDDGKTD